MTDYKNLIADARTDLSDADRCHFYRIEPHGPTIERALARVLPAMEALLIERDEARAKCDALQAQVDNVRHARSNHPECDRHPDDDPVSCGWKRVVLDIDAALAKEADL